MDSITKTLLLAQRTADATLAEAREEAEGIRKRGLRAGGEHPRRGQGAGEPDHHRGRAGGAAHRRDHPFAGGRGGGGARGTASALSDDVDALSGPHHVPAGAAGLAVVAAQPGALEQPDGLQDAPTPALSRVAGRPAGPPALVPPTEPGALPEPPPTEFMTEPGAQDGRAPCRPTRPTLASRAAGRGRARRTRSPRRSRRSTRPSRRRGRSSTRARRATTAGSADASHGALTHGRPDRSPWRRKPAGSLAGPMAYPTVDPQPSFPALEAEVLAFWEGDKTFPASVEQRARRRRGRQRVRLLRRPALRQRPARTTATCSPAS